MYWKLKIGHVNRRSICLLLALSVIFILFQDQIFLPSSKRSKVLPLKKSFNLSANQEVDPLKEREKESDYYKLRGVKTDHCDFPFLVDGSKICEEDHGPFLLVLVPSLPHHTYNRQIIRDTWGQFARNKTINGEYDSYVIKLGFVLGRWRNERTRHILLQEKRKHEDLVIGDFEDSYKNLTRKILFGLKWMSIYCGEAEYILKADVDVFVNIPRLVEILTKNPANLTGSVYGHLYGGGRVARTGRWAVSNEEFPMSRYPPYMSGTSYVISGASAPRLLYASQHLPYLSIEDAFITGVLPIINEISKVHIAGFTTWKEPSPKPCTFFRKNEISGNKVSTSLMKTMWMIQQGLPDSCANDGLWMKKKPWTEKPLKLI